MTFFPVQQICADFPIIVAAHVKGIPVMAPGSQAIPHMALDVQEALD